MIRLLHLFDYYGESEAIEIAKGKYKAPTSIKEGMEQIKRVKQWQMKKR